MYFCNMIIFTGAAGFIGSCLVAKLNSLNKTNLILVDDFSNAEKNKLFGGLIGGFRKRRHYNKKRNVTRSRRFTKRRARKTHNRRTRYDY